MQHGVDCGDCVGKWWCPQQLEGGPLRAGNSHVVDGDGLALVEVGPARRHARSANASHVECPDHEDPPGTVVPADPHHVRSCPAADRRISRQRSRHRVDPLALVRLEQLPRNSHSSGRGCPQWAIHMPSRESGRPRLCHGDRTSPAGVSHCRSVPDQGVAWRTLSTDLAAGSSRTPRATFRVPAEPVVTGGGRR
jgi:hypothetical protein